ncbi:MAG: NHL repeat-containing protein [candidate division KSB1 bacterium]|nr:NHL repeat-containing protein [candidate division KSB1 bacterium]
MTLIYLFTLGEAKIEDVSIAEPQAISIDMTGNLYLADTNNNRIIKFDEQNEPVKVVGGFGWGKEEFDYPLDINAKSGLDIFIADYNNSRIERYDKDLNYISSYYSDESLDEDLQFDYPSGVAISIHGEIVLVDAENERLLKINSFGQPEISFGDYSEGVGRLDNPAQVEIGVNDRIYVSDQNGAVVVVYDYFGNYLTNIGEGLLSRPYGIAVDGYNRIWVADRDEKAVFAFSSSGDLLLRHPAAEAESQEIIDPKDIAIYRNRAYVLDGNRIHVFEIIQNHLE